ncbi:MAG: hypothetical protein LLF81_09460 [Porphyromonadaceae bacterium]|nr:hypothetical protein [Porphyromonadaceae bacterium]
MKTKINIDSNTYVDLDPVHLDKAKKEYLIKMGELSFSFFSKFEEDNIRNAFNLFEMDGDNKLILDRELFINPYISLYEIPICYYKPKTMEKGEVYKMERVVFYPSFLGTGKLRMEFYPLKIYGKFLKSLIEINRTFTLFELIQNLANSNKNLDYSLIESRMIIAVRNLLCNQLLILK